MVMAPFAATVRQISDDVAREMVGCSWRDVPECPRLSDLRLLQLSHHTFAGQVQVGSLVVAAVVADEVVSIFERIFAAGFAIERMQRVDVFAASDEASMAANNSSAFNFRRVQGTQVLSHHALGLAIDLNPVQNPWLRNDLVDPPAGRAYLDRAQVRVGMIVAGDAVVEAFAAHGWHWGGDWQDMRDFQHFSKLPRLLLTCA